MIKKILTLTLLTVCSLSAQTVYSVTPYGPGTVYVNPPVVQQPTVVYNNTTVVYNTTVVNNYQQPQTYYRPYQQPVTYYRSYTPTYYAPVNNCTKSRPRITVTAQTAPGVFVTISQ